MKLNRQENFYNICYIFLFILKLTSKNLVCHILQLMRKYFNDDNIKCKDNELNLQNSARKMCNVSLHDRYISCSVEWKIRTWIRDIEKGSAIRRGKSKLTKNIIKRCIYLNPIILGWPRFDDLSQISFGKPKIPKTLSNSNINPKCEKISPFWR